MQERIRIIKRGTQQATNVIPPHPITKSARERERETVNTVKGWIVEWEQRKHALQNAAHSLLRSIGDSSETPTKPLAIMN
jgi:hypothetical protein